MIAAELLKLRRTPAAVWTAVLCAVGLPLVVLALDALSGGPAYGGAGCAEGAFKAALWPGLAAACAIGVAAGTSDRASGVLRTLAATGCRRSRLLAVRVPAVLVAVVVYVAVNWAVIVALGTWVRHDRPPVALGDAVDQLPGMLTVNLVLALAGLSLGAAGMSAALATTLLLGGVLGGLPLAGASSVPDVLLALLPPVALRALVGGTQLIEVPLPAGLALAGTLAWLVVLPAVGAWRFARMEL